jgi:hypothetical protein
MGPRCERNEYATIGTRIALNQGRDSYMRPSIRVPDKKHNTNTTGDNIQSNQVLLGTVKSTMHIEGLSGIKPKASKVDELFLVWL